MGLSEPQRRLLEEARESATGSLFVKMGSGYERTAESLVRRGLLIRVRTFVRLGQVEYVAKRVAP